MRHRRAASEALQSPRAKLILFRLCLSIASRGPVQIGSNLRPSEYEDFKSYAAGLQLTQSAVASLLVMRELRQRRLRQLTEQTVEHRGLSRHRITANVDAGTKAAFAAYLGALNIGSDAAAGILFRTELSERWLDRAVG